MQVKIWRVAAVCWICVIFFSSTSTASRWCESGFSYFSQVFFGNLHPQSSGYDLIHLLVDKGLHVTLFCVFAVLLWQAFPHISRKWGVILLCGAIVGSCSEFLQRFFPGRDPAIRDVLINIGGTAVGLSICFVWTRRGIKGEQQPLREDQLVVK